MAAPSSLSSSLSSCSYKSTGAGWTLACCVRQQKANTSVPESLQGLSEHERCCLICHSLLRLPKYLLTSQRYLESICLKMCPCGIPRLLWTQFGGVWRSYFGETCGIPINHIRSESLAKELQLFCASQCWSKFMRNAFCCFFSFSFFFVLSFLSSLCPNYIYALPLHGTASDTTEMTRTDTKFLAQKEFKWLGRAF